MTQAGRQAPYQDGIPVVQNSTDRALRFPTPVTDQRVHNLTSGAIERWTAGGWSADLIAPRVFDVKVYGATGDGTTDDTAAIQAAETARALVGGSLLIPEPPVAYKIAGQVSIGSHAVVDARKATFTAGVQSSGSLFLISGNVGTAKLLTANTAEGATTVSLLLADAATFAAGDHVRLYDTTLSGAADYKRERNIVEGVSGTTVTLKYPINFAYLTAASAQLAKVTPVENVRWRGGVFDLTGTTGEVDAIQTNWGYNVRVEQARGTKHTGKIVQHWDGLNVHSVGIHATRATDVTAGHGYGTQLIYCRHSSTSYSYGEDVRHVDDVSGGSDISVAFSKGVSSSAGVMTAGVFTHGLYAKRVQIAFPNISGGAAQGVAVGTSSFITDEDVTVIEPMTNGCSDGVALTAATRCKVIGGLSKDSIVRGLAVTGGADIDLDGLTIDGIQTNPSNYGAADFASGATAVRARLKVRNALYQSVRVNGTGDYDFVDLDVDHAGTSTAFAATGLTGRFRVLRGKYLNRTASVDTVSINGATTETIVQDTHAEGVGATPSSGIKVLGAPTSCRVRGAYVKGMAEGIRVENVVGPVLGGNTLDACGNGIRLVAPMTFVDFEGGNTFIGITTNPVVNSPPANVVQGMSPNRGDTSITVKAGQDCRTQYFNTPLTANRTATVSLTANERIAGQRFRFTRGAGATGAFNLTVQDATPTTLKVLGTAGTWCEVEDQGAAGIVLSASGSL